VTVVVGVAEGEALDPERGRRYAEDGSFEVRIAVAADDGVPVYGFPDGPDFPFRRTSEQVAAAIPSQARVVYAPDRGALAIVPLRLARLAGSAPRRTYVTVGHGTSKWVRDAGGRPSADAFGDLSLGFAERYVLERADRVVTPSRYYLVARARGDAAAGRAARSAIPGSGGRCP
jgi:hypothetical protein